MASTTRKLSNRTALVEPAITRESGVELSAQARARLDARCAELTREPGLDIRREELRVAPSDAELNRAWHLAYTELAVLDIDRLKEFAITYATSRRATGFDAQHYSQAPQFCRWMDQLREKYAGVSPGVVELPPPA